MHAAKMLTRTNRNPTLDMAVSYTRERIARLAGKVHEILAACRRSFSGLPIFNAA
jgi:hypothetical protein